MKLSSIYYAGLMLAIFGLIGMISESGPVWSRYIVLGLGIVLLIIAYVKRSRSQE